MRGGRRDRPGRPGGREPGPDAGCGHVRRAAGPPAGEIREYGTEQLEARAEAEATRRAHAAWYLDLAEQAAPALAGPDVVSWLARLDADHDNLRAALRWVLDEDNRDEGDGTAALRLAGALGRYWAHRGHLSEGASGAPRPSRGPVVPGRGRHSFG